MKKVLGVLASVALILVIWAAVLFGTNSFKDLTEDNKDDKTEQIKEKEGNESSDKDSTENNSSVEDNQEVDNNDQIDPGEGVGSEVDEEDMIEE